MTVDIFLNILEEIRRSKNVRKTRLSRNYFDCPRYSKIRCRFIWREQISRAIKRNFHHQTNLLLTHWNKLDNTVRKESGIKCGTFYKKPFTMLRTSKQGIIVELKTKGTQQPRIMHKS